MLDQLGQGIRPDAHPLENLGEREKKQTVAKRPPISC
jgi:hypothetical protein